MTGITTPPTAPLAVAREEKMSPSFSSFDAYCKRLPDHIDTAMIRAAGLVLSISIALGTLHGTLSLTVCKLVLQVATLSATLVLIDSAVKPIFNWIFQEHNSIRNLAHYVVAPLILGVITQTAGVKSFRILDTIIVNGICTFWAGGEHHPERVSNWLAF